MVQNMTMTCPDGWSDASMLILRADAPGSSGVIPNLVVTRDRLPGDLPDDPTERMTHLIDRQVAEMRPKLAGFAEVLRWISGDTAPPVGEVKVDWTSGATELTQALRLVDGGDGMLLIATATAGRSDFAAVEDQFKAMLGSFRLA